MTIDELIVYTCKSVKLYNEVFKLNKRIKQISNRIKRIKLRRKKLIAYKLTYFS